MLLACIADFPCPACGTVVVSARLAFSRQLGPFGVEAVAVLVLWAAYRCIRGHRIGDEDCVIWPVDVGVDT